MKRLLILLTLLLTQNTALAWSPQLEAEFQQRSREYLEKFKPGEYGSTAYEYEKQSYPKAMIDFLRGNRGQALPEVSRANANSVPEAFGPAVPEAIAFLEGEDKQSELHSHTLGIDFYSGFTLKGQVRKYFGFGQFLSPGYKLRMREAMGLFTRVDPLKSRFNQPRKFWENSTDNCNTWVDCRDTDNLKAMREVAVYLMSEEAGNERTRLIYKQRIAQKVRSLYMTGQGEWDSETYLGHGLTTYVNLYDYAKDPEVKQLAKSALDWFTTTGALKYWRGGFGGPSKRDYGKGNCVWCSGASQALGLYFGDSPVKDLNQNPDLVHLIMSSYRPPTVAVALARKEFTKPLELLNSKPDYLNWKEDKPPAFHETLYFGETFQLGTLAEGSAVDWSGFKMMAENSRRGVDYFIPSSSKPHSIAQYQNLAVWLGVGDVQFFLPKSAVVEILGGKLFIKLEKTYLAIAPINLTFGNITSAPNYPDNLVLSTIKGEGIAGFALEVGEGNWESFKRGVLVNSQLRVSSSASLTAKTERSRSFRGAVAEYISLKNRVKLEYTSTTPKVWRNGRFHNWSVHRDVYRADVTNLGKVPIYQAYKSGKLEAIAGGQSYERSQK